VQVELPFAFDGERAYIRRECSSHLDLLCVLAGIDPAEEAPESRVEQVQRWLDEAQRRLGRVLIEDGAVVLFDLYTNADAFFEAQPEPESETSLHEQCADALHAAVATLR
jgi:hypothetical protein